MLQVTIAKHQEQLCAHRAQPAPSMQLRARRVCKHAPNAPQAFGRSRARLRAGVFIVIQQDRLGSRPSLTSAAAAPSQKPIAIALRQARAYGNILTAHGVVTVQRRSRHVVLGKGSTLSSSPIRFSCQFAARAQLDTFGVKRGPNLVTARSAPLDGTSQKQERQTASLVHAATAALVVLQRRVTRTHVAMVSTSATKLMVASACLLALVWARPRCNPFLVHTLTGVVVGLASGKARHTSRPTKLMRARA